MRWNEIRVIVEYRNSADIVTYAEMYTGIFSEDAKTLYCVRTSYYGCPEYITVRFKDTFSYKDSTSDRFISVSDEIGLDDSRIQQGVPENFKVLLDSYL